MEFTRTLSYEFPLMRGEDVRSVQQALIALKVDPPCGAADGVFGYMTSLTVKSFQHNYNIAGRSTGPAVAENGELAQDTWNALFQRAKDIDAPASRIQTAAAAMTAPPPGSASLPATCLNAQQVKKVSTWMAQHYGPQITTAAAKIGVDANLIYAIACQETASLWFRWMETMTPDQVLARCVFDSSGDIPEGGREAFPKNTAEFRSRFGDALTQQLIDEANATRALRGLPPAQVVYKGYGVFQYDLQNIVSDSDFFANRGWANFQACLDRLIQVLTVKLSRAQGNIAEAVKAYNGAGPAADRYAAAVLQMREWA
jgi:Putative peptidoglycan binding domain